MIKIGILGGAGYTAGELIRLLINHHQAQIVFVNSESNAGNLITDVHEGLIGDTDMRFTSETPFDDVDVVFFCFGHGKSEQFLQTHDMPKRVKIIDLAQDFRLEAEGNDFVYGLPEINREHIAKAQHVANPGCFATCIQLGLLPAASLHIINDDVMVNAITGSTGCRSEARIHNSFLMACRKYEHLQTFQPPTRTGDKTKRAPSARLS
jgi:N-acetyl-gamma-glutamyl-phosphate reductase